MPEKTQKQEASGNEAKSENVLDIAARQLAQRSAQTSYRITETEEGIRDIDRAIDQLKANREQLFGELESLRKASSDLRAAWKFLQPILEGGQNGNPG